MLEHILLSRLEVDGPLATAELADVFLLDTSTVHRQMTALLRAGLVAHRAHLQGLFAPGAADPGAGQELASRP